MSQDWIMEVSDLNDYVRKALDSDPVLRSIRLRGELSNFRRVASGHWYFTLKDERCRIACVMFRQNAMRMSMKPQDGMRVILSGNVSLYPESGIYQFYAEAMRPDGMGSLQQRFEQLKAKLMAEGLMDASRKRMLPLRPRRIAVVTSETGAVLQDIRRVSAMRDAGVPLVLVPVTVQGETAAAEIARAIRKAATLPEVDVIITGRGGGSMEDLWAFNEEVVARAIAESPIPVISAVGHETDFTIADFVADVRASTPSNAAELAVPNREELIDTLTMLRRHLTSQAQTAIRKRKLRLMTLEKRLNALHPAEKLSELRHRLSMCCARLNSAAEQSVSSQIPRLPVLRMRLDNAMDTQLHKVSERSTNLKTRLNSVSPMRVLERGYVLVTAGKRVLTSVQDAQQENQMTLRFRDGYVAVERKDESVIG